MKRTLVFLGLCVVLALSITSIVQAQVFPRGCCDSDNRFCTRDINGKTWTGPRDCYELR